jgi:hypothetical protein
MKIERLNHEEHEEHEGRAMKKSIMDFLLRSPAAFSRRASLRDAFLRVLRVLRGHIFRFGFSMPEVTR